MKTAFAAGLVLGAVAISGYFAPARAAAPEVTEPPYFSGESALPAGTTEPALDDLTGDTVFLLTPSGAPLPSKANPRAQDVMYIPVYPLASSISPDHLDCQTGAVGGTGNCTHLQVLPFPDPAYDANTADELGTSQACVDFNGGNPCTVYKGHDHLVGVPSTRGDYNVAWYVKLVVFTPQGVSDGAINTRITTVSTIDALKLSGDVDILPSPVVFNCQTVSETVYNHGSPVTFSFP